MKRRNIFLIPTIILFAGCGLFLPGGKAPEGNIISPDTPESVTELIFSRAEAVDYFINELVRETMLNCPGEAVFIDADRQSQREVKRILNKTSEFSGVSNAAQAKGNWQLVSRNRAGSWQMELLSKDGNAVWKRSVILKNK
ncbi:MAG: hypothetical protein J6R86_00165 [Lentisphaeria bacterium]|nr:hypothetical protein [Lentisphaeria bacterium]